jgi:hypothetical protein
LRAVCLCLAVAACGGYARAQQSSGQNQAAPAQPPSSPPPKSDSAGAQAQPSSTSTPSMPTSTPTAQGDKTADEKEKEIQKQEQSQRALGFYPQFAVTSRQKVPPLSPGAKFHLFFKSSFDPFAFVLAGIQAGSDQAEDEFPGYGEGAQGFGKRYAADFGDALSSGFWTDFFWPVVTREDPRYFRLGHGRIIYRLAYGFAQTVVCRTDKGGETFNFSNFLGAFSAGALSNTYHPQGDRGVALTARGASFALAYGSLGQLFNEFWPDIHEKIRKHHNKNHPPQTPTTNPLP